MRRSDGKKGIQLLQQEKGYRSSLDPFLLADFVQVRKENRVMDLGTGNGVILVLLAARQEESQLVGLEIQPELAALARHNVTLNGLKQIQIIQGDIRRVYSLFARESFDVVVGNPPYRKVGEGRLNPDPAKAIARHEVKLTLREFLKSAQYLLKDKGRLLVIYHPGRLTELLTQLEQLRIGPRRLRFVHSTLHSPAKMVLVEGVKGGQGKTEVLPPLMVYSQPQMYSSEMKRIFGERQSEGA